MKRRAVLGTSRISHCSFKENGDHDRTTSNNTFQPQVTPASRLEPNNTQHPGLWPPARHHTSSFNNNPTSSEHWYQIFSTTTPAWGGGVTTMKTSTVLSRLRSKGYLSKSVLVHRDIYHKTAQSNTFVLCIYQSLHGVYVHVLSWWQNELQILMTWLLYFILIVPMQYDIIATSDHSDDMWSYLIVVPKRS